MQKTKKRSFSGRLLSFAAAFATAVSALSALPALPALKAQAAGSVTLSSDGTLTLSGAVTKDQIWAYRENSSVKRVVAADDCVLPEDCAELFEGCVTETWDEYDDNGEFIMEDSENYLYWTSLVSVDLSKADASRVTTMAFMFASCDAALQSVDLSGLNTCNLKRTNNMFNQPEIYQPRHGHITSLNLSGFQTSKVTDMEGMFSGCDDLTSLDLSSFDTSNVTDMYGMFGYYYFGCRKLTTLDLSSFDTSKVTDMSEMFCSCEQLTTIYVSDLWNTNAVSSSADMFISCTNLVGGNGTVYDDSKTDKTYARIDKPGQPGYLTDANTVTYELYISGTQVTAGNKSDILGDGVFSYNPAKKRLTINGDFTTTEDRLIESHIPGLTVYTANDSVLESFGPVLFCEGDAHITGPGKLTLCSEADCGIYQINGELTIEDADIDASGVWGIAGRPDNESLKIINSSVHAAGANGAVTDFEYGITLTDCQIDPPGSLYINLYVEECGCDENGDSLDKYRWSIDTAESADFYNQADPAAEVSIVPAREYNMWIGGVKVSSRNRNDVLGNGVFAYDPDTKTLRISGDYQYSRNTSGAHISQSVIESMIPGLTINVCQDSVLTAGTGADGGIKLYGNTTLTGSGKLTLNGGYHGIFLDYDAEDDCWETGSNLTIKDAAVEIHAMYGITTGLEFYDHYLTVDHSNLIIDASDAAVKYISGGYDSEGIILRNCQIVTPAGGTVAMHENPSNPDWDDDGGDGPDVSSWYYIAEADDTAAKKAVISDGSLTGATVSLTKNEFAWTGKEVKIGSYVRVKSGETTLKYNTDFTLSYANNVSCGINTASVTITGIGSYTGSVTKYYSILPKKQAKPVLSTALSPNNSWGLHVEWAADENAQGYQADYCQNNSFTGDTLHTVSFASKTACDLTTYPKLGETWYVRVRSYIKDSAGTKYGLWSNTAGITLTAPVTEVNLTQTQFAYTGSAVKIGSYVRVKSGTTALKYNTDFTMSYENNVNCGVNTAKITITGIGNYCGSVTKYYSILPKKQAKPTLSMNGSVLHVKWAADSNAKGYQVQYCKDTSFTGDTFHSKAFATKTECDLSDYPKPGETWYVRVRSYLTNSAGTKYGLWSETAGITLTVPVTDVTLTQTEFTWTGKEVKVGSYVRVKSGTTALKYGRDFTMSYENNVNCGVNTASVTITGIGNYTGTVTKNYSILPKQQAKPALSSALSPKGNLGIHAEWTADANAQGYQLDYCQTPDFSGDTLHTVTYASKTACDLTTYPQPGETWYVRVRSYIKDSAGTKYGFWSETASITHAAFDSVKLSRTSFTYTGKEIKVGSYLTVRSGDTALKYGQDFTLSYSNNVSAGTATVTVTGIGCYQGMISRIYTIAPKALTSDNVTLTKTSFDYTGKEIKVGSYIRVKDGDTALKYGQDFTLSYSNNINKGTATVTVTGTGNYKGTVNKTYTIK